MSFEQALIDLRDGLQARAADIAAGRAPSFGVDQIKAIAQGLSVDLPDTVDTFVFYSGSYLPEKVLANDAAVALAAQSARIGIIDNTELGKFLISDDLNDAMRQLDPSGAAQFGTGLSDAQMASTLWGQASTRFVATASGNVIALTLPETVNPNGIWSQIEFEALLRNGNVEKINGLSRFDLLAKVDNPGASFAIADALREVEVAHANHLTFGDITFDKNLAGQISYGDQFLSMNYVDSQGFAINPNIVDPIDPGGRSWFQLTFDPDYVRAGTALAALGYVGDALSAYVTYAQASELASQGDYLGATRSWFGWAANTGGSLGGGVFGGLAFSVFGPGGTVGGALVGGYAGGQAAEDIANFAFDHGIAPSARFIYDLLPASQAPPASQLSLMDIDGGVAWVDQSGFAWQTATGDATGFGELKFYRPGGGVHGVETLQPDGTRSTTLFDAFGREVAQRTETATTGEQTIRVSDPTEEYGWSFNEARIVNGESIEVTRGFASGATVSNTRDPLSDPENPASWPTTVKLAPREQAQAPVTKPLITGSQVGAIVGSSLGQLIGGDNVFAQVVAGSALSTALSAVGADFDKYVLGLDGKGLSVFDAVTGSFGAAANLGTAFAANLRGQGIGALSSFLTAELAEELGVNSDGFGGALFSYASNPYVGGPANDNAPWTEVRDAA